MKVVRNYKLRLSSDSEDDGVSESSHEFQHNLMHKDQILWS